MNFALTQEQELLKETVRRFVADSHSFEQRRVAASHPEGFAREHWALFAELGWLGVAVSEEAGGFGGSMIEAAIVLEELARGLVGAPFLTTAVLCAGLIESCTDYSERVALLERIIAGDAFVALAGEEPGSRYDLAHVATTVRPAAGGGAVLDGRKIVVLDGGAADVFVVSARAFGGARDRRGVSLWVVPRDAPGLSIRPYRTIDQRGAADVILDRVRVADTAQLAGPDHGYDRLAVAVDRAAVGVAADSLGAMEAAIQLTADYVKTRQQFGRPIGQFQVLQHRLSDMFVAVENARSMVYRGLAMLDMPAAVRAKAVSATRIAVTQAGAFVGQQAIQLHGGIGMTEEYPVGHYYKRLQTAGKTFGDLSFHMARYDASDDAFREQGAA